jgi:quercetin dioxygenase-like cupin family protein
VDGEPENKRWRAIHPPPTPKENGAMSTFKSLTTVCLVSVLCLIRVPLSAQEPTVASLLAKTLTDIPGKEVLILTVEFAPGGADPIHRHDAHGFIYVLEGSVVMQVKGGEPVTLTAGQTYYEGPDDVHIVGRNASTTRPARLLAVLLKKTGAPPQVLLDEGELMAPTMKPARRSQPPRRP